jgi:hypothetical protein
MKIKFNKLFVICKQQNWEVARVLNGGVINLSFRRNFGNEEILEWEEMERELEQVNVTSPSLKRTVCHNQDLYGLSLPK